MTPKSIRYPQSRHVSQIANHYNLLSSQKLPISHGLPTPLFVRFPREGRVRTIE